MTLEVAGIRLELLHLPGETPDQIGIWWADKRAVMVGDNFYWALPNLYTLRGTSYRDLAAWARSLETLRDLGADFIVPSHNRPLAGAVTVATALESTRDAVRYLHDQGIRAIAAGATPDEMVHEIALPPHLAEAAWLQPFYGRTDWALRALFAGTLGWFDGDAAHIAPLPPAEQATLWVEAAGGAEALKGRAAEKLAAGEAQAAIELIGPVLRLSPTTRRRAACGCVRCGLGHAANRTPTPAIGTSPRRANWRPAVFSPSRRSPVPNRWRSCRCRWSSRRSARIWTAPPPGISKPRSAGISATPTNAGC